jgi:hypothetical protein
VLGSHIGNAQKKLRMLNVVCKVTDHLEHARLGLERSDAESLPPVQKSLA